MYVCVCVYVHFLNFLRSSLSTGCPVSAELGLDSTVLVDKSFYGRLLNLSTVDICSWVSLCGGAVLCLVGCGAASLASSC